MSERRQTHRRWRSALSVVAAVVGIWNAPLPLPFVAWAAAGPRLRRGGVAAKPPAPFVQRRAQSFPASKFPTSDDPSVCSGDGLKADLLRTLPANLPQSAANVIPAKSPPGSSVLFRVAPGGELSEETTSMSDLWRTGALVVVVRRPGCAMSREQAYALSQAYSAVIADPSLPGMPRLFAIVRESVKNDDGNSEVDAFREYFPGEVFVDPNLATFKALGDRQYTDGIYSQDSARWYLQRMAGMQRRTIDGHFEGVPDTALKFGGCFVFDRAGEVRYAHQEGVTSIDYEAVRKALLDV